MLKRRLKLYKIVPPLLATFVVLLIVYLVCFTPKTVPFTINIPNYEEATHVYYELYGTAFYPIASSGRVPLPQSVTVKALEGTRLTLMVKYYWIEGRESQLLTEKTYTYTVVKVS